ncbi:MAG: D-aminoacylase [Flavisolibacter sp.]|jgi:N-acyl-D-amino-acid deacylase|nr:D-aminoacylase [Flavisolibacter sp.]
MKLPIIVLFFFTFFQVSAQDSVDLIIKNGRILDGTGNSWYRADIAVRDGRIVRIGNLHLLKSKRSIDAAGKIVTPGFIDVHTHIEGDELINPTANNFILDGVTTVITGNCGASNVDIKKYLQMIDSLKTSVNVASLVGHNDVRRAIMGRANRKPTEDEMKRMENLVEAAMQGGAVGLSTGLLYIPGAYSETDEIVRLAKVAAKYNGVYASHMRSEGDSVIRAINEALEIGRQARIPVQISHFKVSGHHNWGRSRQTLALVQAAREEGIEVTIDQYPYTASSTSLSTLLPDEILADGNDSIMARLQRPEVRAYVIDALLKNLKKRKLKHFSYAVVASHRADSTYNGKSIEQINLMKGRKHKGKEEALTIIDMMLAGGAGMVFHGMSEEDVKRIMQYPFNMFASDASIRIYNQGVPHPRGYGTNARVIGNYVRDQKILTLEEAIRRMTSLPAQKFGLRDRGLIREGFAADILIFDEKEVQDISSFEKPHAYSKGFHYVIVNGQVVVDAGVHNGTRSGMPIFSSGAAKLF